MIESTKNYYEKKSEHITEMFMKNIQDKIEEYEGFINTPFSKNMIRVKFEYDLTYDFQQNINNNTYSEDDIIELVIEESLDSLIFSSLTNKKITSDKEVEILLNTQDKKTSANNIKEYLVLMI